MLMRYSFIVNSKARTGKGIHIWNRLENILKEKNVSYDVYLTEYAGHAKILAQELTSGQNESVIVIVGGDGTVNEVLNGISDFSKVKFGYLPIGSANDLALGLGIKNIPVEDLLIQMLEGKFSSFQMDLGRATDSMGHQTYFAISSGIGIDAEVCKAALTSKLKKFLNAIKLGGLTYKLLTLHKLFTMPHVNCKITLDDKDAISIRQGIFAVGMNQPVEGGGVPMAPDAVCTDGKLTLCCVYGYSKLGAFVALPALLAGKQTGKKGFWIENFKKAEIELESEMVLHADGEYCGEHKHVTLECLPGILKFI